MSHPLKTLISILIMKNESYTCEECGNSYFKSRPDNVAIAESESKFAMPVSEKTHAIVCDDCFKKIFDN